MKLTLPSEHLTLDVAQGAVLLDALREHGLQPDAPCGGRGTCGKCRVVVNGVERLACQTKVEKDMTVALPEKMTAQILSSAQRASVVPDGTGTYCLAFDLGTTTVAAYLMDAKSGETLAQANCMNPQIQYGADVISRIQYALEGHGRDLSSCVRQVLAGLTREAARHADISPEEISTACIVGNTAMHHLLLNIDPKPLIVPPYMPAARESLCLPAKDLLPIAKDGAVRILPNIAGFVGSDTVGCLLATGLDTAEELTLLIDIGTNGEMVLGDRNRRIACSTAAGPAFEGARIECGMRGTAGAVDHAAIRAGSLVFHTIGGEKPAGLCGSGLLDLIAALLETGELDGSGRLQSGNVFRLEGTGVYLTQKDVREVQLAKAAVRAGIEMMCAAMGVQAEDIRRVLLAGAFGNYMDPASACAIGMIPPVLLDRICPVGNAAGEGAQMAALSRSAFDRSARLAGETAFLELASLPAFNDCYVDCLPFTED